MAQEGPGALGQTQYLWGQRSGSGRQPAFLRPFRLRLWEETLLQEESLGIGFVEYGGVSCIHLSCGARVRELGNGF